MMTENSFQHGVQPLDGILTERGLSNRDVVGASTEHLNFKQVQKGRKGRALTSNLQGKIVRALNAVGEGADYKSADLFTYRGR